MPRINSRIASVGAECKEGKQFFESLALSAGEGEKTDQLPLKERQSCALMVVATRDMKSPGPASEA